MKKLLSILCVAALLLTLALAAGCSESADSDKKESTPDSSTQSVQEPAITAPSADDIVNAVGTATGGATPEEAATEYYTSLYAGNYSKAMQYMTLDSKIALYAKNVGEKVADINVADVTDQMIIDAMDYYYTEEGITNTLNSATVTKTQEVKEEVDKYLIDRAESDKLKKAVTAYAIASINTSASGEGIEEGTIRSSVIVLYKINERWYID